MDKKTFIKRICLIQNFHSQQETLQALINKLVIGYPVVIFGNYLVEEIIDMINDDMKIEDKDLIDWWLYEDVEKLIYDSNGTIIADLQTPGDLYDYITTNK